MSDLFKPKTRFDLEQEIMECWGVTRDIKHVLDMMDRSDRNDDMIMNALIGLEVLYEQKFQTMFETFETCIHNKEM